LTGVGLLKNNPLHAIGMIEDKVHVDQAP